MHCLKNCSVEILNEKPNITKDLLGCFPTRFSLRIREFLSCTQRKNIKISRKELKEWLSSQEAYTRHRRILIKFTRNKVITRGIDDLWQIDLADMQNIARLNENFRYLVTCIDVFSKYAWGDSY